MGWRESLSVLPRKDRKNGKDEAPVQSNLSHISHLPGGVDTSHVKDEHSPEDREFFRVRAPGAVISRKQAPAVGLESISRQFEDGDRRVMWFDQDSHFAMVAWTVDGIPQAPVMLTLPPECDWEAILDRFEATLQ